MQFYKYQGTGNDFILLDNRSKFFDIHDSEKVKKICDRHFGIGADGLILLEDETGYDFKMVFANSDGSIGAMCGNGGRCVVHFAQHVLKLLKNPEKINFVAPDGPHQASINGDTVELSMQDVKDVEKRGDIIFLKSGTTPHAVIFVKELPKYDVFGRGREIRNKENTNVNFVELKNGIFHVRTYERGVEGETLACGTGATSVAIAAHYAGMVKENTCHIKMPGGDLNVSFGKTKDSYKNIWLKGETKLVFTGEF